MTQRAQRIVEQKKKLIQIVSTMKIRDAGEAVVQTKKETLAIVVYKQKKRCLLCVCTNKKRDACQASLPMLKILFVTLKLKLQPVFLF